AAKIALQYLVRGGSSSPQIELLREKIINISPILEAFGNAKTQHNSNSSRFGKFLELEFDCNGDPVGGLITNYLLEKSRVIRQSLGERSFHIFYQLVSGADIHLLKSLKLQRSLDSYNILKLSRCAQIANVDDKINFIETKRALEVMGLTQEEIIFTFHIVASVLKLGNIQYLPRANMDGTEGCTLLNEYEIYDICEMLCIDVNALETSLTQRSVETRNEVLVTDLSASEANYARDALCKALYSRLFTWLINKLNESIRAKRVGKRRSVGILDVYGFEVFERNSYEQFLINYCNEKLHQIYIDVVLRQEQEEYIKEGIHWKRIDFFNNSNICDLIEKNNHGILSMLDEECLRPNPVTDELFLHKLIQTCQENPYFESHGCKSFVVDIHHKSEIHSLSNPSVGALPHHCFRIRHYAGSVTYAISGFVEKNNDLLFKDLSNVMYKSDNPLLRILFPEGNPKRTTLKRPATTASQFKISIGALMKNIQSKQLNFIVCIKPNELKEPLIFEMALVQHQVRYLLLLECCKIKKLGFFFRQEYESFLKKYKMLSACTWPHWTGSTVEGVGNLLKDLPIYLPHCYFGRTKLFIRSARTVFELNEMRRDRLHELATLCQKIWRGWVRRKKFLQIRNSQLVIARNYRCWKRRRYLLWLSKHLPSESPLCRDWPPAPRSLQETSYFLRKCYHKWRCHKYRLNFDQTARNRMREKVTASLIFRDRKVSYLKSVSHPFRGDYVRLRQNLKWKRISAETGDQYVVFADIVNKITRSTGKCVQKLLVLSTVAMIVMDQRTLQIKYRIPVNEIFRISLSPYMDDIVIIHVKCTDATKRKGAFVFESGHVIEIVTKLFLVIQNATAKSTEVQIATEFEANFGKEDVLVLFRCTAPPETTGPAKIVRRATKLEITL
ncbi:unconventional myosin-Ib-like protein, partial [Dinothrombium tinctorium]